MSPAQTDRRVLTASTGPTRLALTSDVRDDPIGHGQTDDGENVGQQEQRSRYNGQLVHFTVGSLIINPCETTTTGDDGTEPNRHPIIVGGHSAAGVGSRKRIFINRHKRNTSEDFNNDACEA